MSDDQADSVKWMDDLALDVANKKVTQRAAFRVAYLKGYEKGYLDSLDDGNSKPRTCPPGGYE